MEVPENLPLLAEEVERNREKGADEETPQETIVGGTRTEHLLGPKGTPKNGSGEESVGIRTGETVLLPRCANIGYLRHLIVEDSRAHKTGNKGSEHLTAECDPRWNMGVMGELEILREVEGVHGRDVSVGLEKIHGIGVTGEPETTEQLSDDVEGDLHVCNSFDDTTRHTKDGGEEDTVQRSSGRGSGGVNGDNDGTDSDGDTQYDEVYPLRNLFVRPH